MRIAEICGACHDTRKSKRKRWCQLSPLLQHRTDTLGHGSQGVYCNRIEGRPERHRLRLIKGDFNPPYLRALLKPKQRALGAPNQLIRIQVCLEHKSPPAIQPDNLIRSPSSAILPR